LKKISYIKEIFPIFAENFFYKRKNHGQYHSATLPEQDRKVFREEYDYRSDWPKKSREKLFVEASARPKAERA
jgi:hypothetical protein